MQQGITVLNQKAIKAALKADWEIAIKINEEILKITPNDTSVKLRLGRAYLQAKEFAKAKKLFKEILDRDPINKIAQKNYELAKNSKTEVSKNNSTKGIIKEPGTTSEISMEITTKGQTANGLNRGDLLELNILKTGVHVTLDNDSGNTELGTLDNSLSQRLYEASNEGAKIKAQVVSGKDKELTLLLKSSLPIFKSKKQETKPYVKKGVISEDSDD